MQSSTETSTSKTSDLKASSPPSPPASREDRALILLKDFCAQPHDDPSINQEMPGLGSFLRLAVILGDYDSVISLLEKNINLNDSQKSAQGDILWKALLSGNAKISQALLDESYNRRERDLIGTATDELTIKAAKKTALSQHQDFLAQYLAVALNLYHSDQGSTSLQDKSKLNRVISLLVRNNAGVHAAINHQIKSSRTTPDDVKTMSRAWRKTIYHHEINKVVDHKKYGEGRSKSFWHDNFEKLKKSLPSLAEVDETTASSLPQPATIDLKERLAQPTQINSTEKDVSEHLQHFSVKHGDPEYLAELLTLAKSTINPERYTRHLNVLFLEAILGYSDATENAPKKDLQFFIELLKEFGATETALISMISRGIREGGSGFDLDDLHEVQRSLQTYNSDLPPSYQATSSSFFQSEPSSSSSVSSSSSSAVQQSPSSSGSSTSSSSLSSYPSTSGTSH